VECNCFKICLYAHKGYDISVENIHKHIRSINIQGKLLSKTEGLGFSCLFVSVG
jgi:hypothetical protein